jgi:predicted dinucleotide-binding enzyme
MLHFDFYYCDIVTPQEEPYMTIGILGSGSVGLALAKGFLAEGHDVQLATREPDGDKADKLKSEVPNAIITDFATAARAAEIAVLCVNSDGLEDILKLIGTEDLNGKVVIDTTNVVTQEKGMMIYGGGKESAAEKVQTSLPDSKIVKAFNTVGAATMYKPDFGGVLPTMFIAGDDEDAKKDVSDIVSMFGWETLDMGKLVIARSLESMALVWINNAMSSGTPHHAFKML